MNEAQWRTLTTSLYPGANSNSVLMVVDYCLARRLDPLKKPCHIVPMEVKDAKSGKYEWRDVVMPGIYELRTTATRTGEYLGHAKPEYGPTVEIVGVTAPEYCDFTVYRWNAAMNGRAEFPVRVRFAEVVAVTRDRQTQEFKANARWSKAPFQMLTKCAEAAALREAFPDELGGEQTAEEMDGQRAIDVTPEEPKAPAIAKPEDFDAWLDGLRVKALAGWAAFEKAWSEARPDQRDYLTTVQPQEYEALKLDAEEADRVKAGGQA